LSRDILTGKFRIEKQWPADIPMIPIDHRSCHFHDHYDKVTGKMGARETDDRSPGKAELITVYG
jgi:hypothetical protein